MGRDWYTDRVVRRQQIKRVDGSTVERADEDEMLRRRVYIRELHALGMPRREVVRRAVEHLAISETQAGYALDGIRKDLRIEYELQAPENHAAALDRAYVDLSNSRIDLQLLRKDKTAAGRDWRAITAVTNNVLRIERHIAELEGTLKPMQLEVGLKGVSESMQRALAQMTPEQVEQAVERERQMLKDKSALVVHGTPGSHGASEASASTTSPQLPAADPLHRIARPLGRPASTAGQPGQVDRVPVSTGRRTDARSEDRRAVRPSDSPHVEERAGLGLANARVIP